MALVYTKGTIITVRKTKVLIKNEKKRTKGNKKTQLLVITRTTLTERRW